MVKYNITAGIFYVKKAAIPLALCLLTFNLMCITTGERDGSANSQHDVTVTHDAHTQAMLAKVAEINDNAPRTFSLKFVITGTVGEKKFKVMGEGAYERESRKMYISLNDFIFKTPIATVFQEGDNFFIYYQVEKKVVMDSISTMRIERYVDFQCDFPIVYNLLTGRLPLIEGYTVRKGLVSGEGDVSYMLLENDRFFETISFRSMIPDRIKFVEKETRRETEVYIKDRIRLNDSTFFNRLKVVSGTDREIEFEFSAIRLNGPVHMKGPDSIPPGIERIAL